MSIGYNRKLLETFSRLKPKQSLSPSENWPFQSKTLDSICVRQTTLDTYGKHFQGLPSSYTLFFFASCQCQIDHFHGKHWILFMAIGIHWTLIVRNFGAYLQPRHDFFLKSLTHYLKIDHSDWIHWMLFMSIRKYQILMEEYTSSI